VIPPGKTVGIFGGGQLGRMTAIAARRMGYQVHIFDPAKHAPAAPVADQVVTADYQDEEAISRFMEGIDVASFEFENIPAATLRFAASRKPVRPSPEVLLICQNREREKLFLRQHNIPHARFAVVSSADELAAAIEEIGTPCVLKTADFGYDGKGQVKIREGEQAAGVWEGFGAPRGVVEQWIHYSAELSVICAANPSGEVETFPIAENIHTDHILEYSIVPARLDSKVADEARSIALRIARAIGLEGLLAVEFFLHRDGRLLVNELAPRPHNSGHYSFDGCVTSQFEQQVRAACDLPLGSTRLLAPTVMCNLLGDLWRRGEPDWAIVLRHPEAKLHLYGKTEARPGRKMGHFCVFGETADEAFSLAQRIKGELRSSAAQ